MKTNNNTEVTLLSDSQVFGSDVVDVVEKFGVTCPVDDFAILLGSFISDRTIFYDTSLRGRLGWGYLSTTDNDGDVRTVSENDDRSWARAGKRSGGVRPVLKYRNFDELHLKILHRNREILEVEYGEYPQYAADPAISSLLDTEFAAHRLKKTGKRYTTDSVAWDSRTIPFKAIKHDEYEYRGKKYVRVKSNCYDGGYTLSNGKKVMPGDYVWVEVSPITWFLDQTNKMLISKNYLLSGLRVCDDGDFRFDFSQSEMYSFLNVFFAKDMISSVQYTMTPEEKKRFEDEQREEERRKNPYGFNFGEVSEEDIIRGAIESGVAVFLHGPSSEGKSARVKEIDPNCVIIYLRNASPESLNGKSVYNQKTGQMIDVKPSWLKKLEEICEKEPDKLHIVFFDEITNALPSIQGIAFNIVLDREVNGVWKLPDNARIVAAGNDMKDSLAANQLAEPLFNRFAHVYIHTTTESWLRWASDHHIHPAIYSYIAYKKGSVLRSEYNGETPNADPRKWEMASKMLYATGSPEMLRALIGEDITKEFVEFCNQRVITLSDVINDNYREEDIDLLDTAQRHATITGLTQVDDANLEKVRKFVGKIGAEFAAIFDALWTHGDEAKIERLAEAIMAAESEEDMGK